MFSTFAEKLHHKKISSQRLFRYLYTLAISVNYTLHQKQFSNSAKENSDLISKS